jgi:hypothetical protein
MKSPLAMERCELRERLAKRQKRPKYIPAPFSDSSDETTLLLQADSSRESLKGVFTEIRSRCGREFPSPLGEK